MGAGIVAREEVVARGVTPAVLPPPQRAHARQEVEVRRPVGQRGHGTPLLVRCERVAEVQVRLGGSGLNARPVALELPCVAGQPSDRLAAHAGAPRRGGVLDRPFDVVHALYVVGQHAGAVQPVEDPLAAELPETNVALEQLAPCAEE